MDETDKCKAWDDFPPDSVGWTRPSAFEAFSKAYTGKYVGSPPWFCMYCGNANAIYHPVCQHCDHHAAETSAGILFRQNKRLLEIVEKLHPRVIKLAMRDKPFIVIGCHEPYFADAYAMIRGQEQVQGTWTDEDERLMQETIKCG